MSPFLTQISNYGDPGPDGIDIEGTVEAAGIGKRMIAETNDYQAYVLCFT